MNQTKALCTTSSRTGGELLINQLVEFGTSRVFMVPGESFLPCIDALYEKQENIETIVCRHESGATFAAEAHAKLSKEPGIAFVSRGPGATNASIGIHTAQQDSTPLIVFIGQVGRDTMDRDSFQEVNYVRYFASITKWTAQIEDVDRIPEYLARAYTIACSGRPGPVVLALPEDMLAEHTTRAVVHKPQRATGSPSPSQLLHMLDMIKEAQQPVLLLGGHNWTNEARNVIKHFVESTGLLVATAWRRLELFDNDHPQFIGQVSASMPAHQRRTLEKSDLVIALGTRLCEPTTINYEWLASPIPQQRLIHIYPDGGEINKVCDATLGIVADVNDFAQACKELSEEAATAALSQRFAELEATKHTRQLSTPLREDPVPAMSGPLDLNACARIVADSLQAPSCVTVGAGNYALYAHRHIRFKGLGSQLSPSVGAMGYSLPAAIAAKLYQRDQHVLCFAGDGCYQMTMQEFATAVQYRLGIVVLVFNNALYGTIRLHQERNFPGRPFSTELVNPDFAALARSYGVFGQQVTRTEQFADALSQALAYTQENSLPAMIELSYAPNQILPDKTLEDVRQAMT